MNWLSYRLSFLPNTFLLAWGLQRRLLCILLGAATAFALPPYNLSVVLLIAFPCLVWLLDGAIEPGRGRVWARVRTGFALGWLFGFGYFLSGLWWIGTAFLVDGDRFAWLMPFAVVAMPVGLALFTGAGVALAAVFWSGRFQRILLLAACLTLSDWVRGHVLTGFPWNAFGYGVSGVLPLTQIASLVGLYGLTFLVVAIAATPAVLADTRPFTQRAGAVSLAAGALVLVAVFGCLRLWMLAPVDSDLDIRIVQPAIDQADKWRPELKDGIFRTYLDMTEAPLGGNARVGQQRLVVWPESAVPFLLTQEPGALFKIGNALGENSELATGAVRSEPGTQKNEYFNSIYLIANDGTVEGFYDKMRLVPFGEFVPLKPLLETLGISSLAGPLEGFEAGYQRRVLSTSAGTGFLPLICYEVIFPGLAGEVTGNTAFLLNVTNDAWFGRTPGPYQHFEQARMRAIETGLPVVRAANTGISAIVDGAGNIVGQLPIFERGVLDVKLPQGLSRNIYVKFGDLPVLFISITLVGFACFSRCNQNSREN